MGKYDIVAVAEILAEYRGDDDTINSGSISDKTGLDSLDSTPRTRGVIRDLQLQYDWPIASSGVGYFLITEHREAYEYIETLENRIQGIEKRKNAVISAINRRGVVDESTDVEQWIDDVRDEVEEDDDD